MGTPRAARVRASSHSIARIGTRRERPYNRAAGEANESDGGSMPIPTGRVVILVLDGFPPHCVSPDVTPTLLRLAEDGALAPEGGITDLVASTAPGHAALLTGTNHTRHGVLANRM